MYLSLLGKPTDQDLETYPAVHLTGPHEWDPSVLDYTHPSVMGRLLCPMTLMRDMPLIPILMNLVIIPKGQFILSDPWMTLHPLYDRIPSTTPGAEPPRDARDSGSARSHSTHLETSSSDRP